LEFIKIDIGEEFLKKFARFARCVTNFISDVIVYHKWIVKLAKKFREIRKLVKDGIVELAQGKSQ